MKCAKCGCDSKVHKKKQGTFLCSVCHHFSPDNEKDFNSYVSEKVNSDDLETFRKYNVSSGQRQKKGMIKKVVKGKVMSRAPFGYKIEEKKLVPAQNYKEVEEIFEEFLSGSGSLRNLAGKHNFSVNGLKKILRNFTYIGKIKFDNEIYESSHKKLISTTLFNQVQDKLEKLGIK